MHHGEGWGGGGGTSILTYMGRVVFQGIFFTA